MGCATQGQSADTTVTTEHQQQKIKKESFDKGQSLEKKQKKFVSNTFRFVNSKTVHLFGGYFVKPKKNESLQKSQVYISATSGTQFKCEVKAKGKVGLIAMKAGTTFPLTNITDIVETGQIEDDYTSITVTSPNVNGVVVYIISEGERCQFTVTSQRMILEMTVHDPSYNPEKQTKIGERKQNHNQSTNLHEKKFIKHYSVGLHGGFIVRPDVGEQIDDNQMIISAPTGNEVKIQATIEGKKKVGLIALKYDGIFPVSQITDFLGYAEPTDGMCEMIVTSPGCQGFIVYIMSNGAPCSINVDGQDKMLLSVIHDSDHQSNSRKSSLSQSSTSSINRRPETTTECTKLYFAKKFNCTLQGGQLLSEEVGQSLHDTQQIMAYAPSNNKICVNLKGTGKIQAVAMIRDSYPLAKSTTQIAQSSGDGTCTLEFASPGFRGFIIAVAGDGKIEFELDAQDKIFCQVVYDKKITV